MKLHQNFSELYKVHWQKKTGPICTIPRGSWHLTSLHASRAACVWCAPAGHTTKVQSDYLYWSCIKKNESNIIENKKHVQKKNKKHNQEFIFLCGHRRSNQRAAAPKILNKKQVPTGKSEPTRRTAPQGSEEQRKKKQSTCSIIIITFPPNFGRVSEAHFYRQNESSLYATSFGAAKHSRSHTLTINPHLCTHFKQDNFSIRKEFFL